MVVTAKALSLAGSEAQAYRYIQNGDHLGSRRSELRNKQTRILLSIENQEVV